MSEHPFIQAARRVPECSTLELVDIHDILDELASKSISKVAGGYLAWKFYEVWNCPIPEGEHRTPAQEEVNLRLEQYVFSDEFIGICEQALRHFVEYAKGRGYTDIAQAVKDMYPLYP